LPKDAHRLREIDESALARDNDLYSRVGFFVREPSPTLVVMMKLSTESELNIFAATL
jgi:hypothetical protein